MHQSVASIQATLKGTLLEGAVVSEVWHSCSPHSSFVVELASAHVIECAELLQSLVPVTGRYPLVSDQEWISLLYMDTPPHDAVTADEDWYAQVTAQANTIDVSCDPLAGGIFSPLLTDDLFGWLDRPVNEWHFLNETLSRFGSCPSADEILALRSSGVWRTDADLERWLLQWELEHFGQAAIAPLQTDYLKWGKFVDTTRYVAVLPPTPVSWEAFAYMHWNGAEERAAEKIAVLRKWNDRYGAKLVCSFSETLFVKIARRPASIEEAFDLAIEQIHFASDATLLYGVSVRDHARALYALDRWFFWAKS
jgi:Domain of unknown function (DUF4253)